MEEVAIEKAVFYIDDQFRCHKEYAEGLTVCSSDFFVGKEYMIPMYRFVPVGMHWIREDGEIFYGEMCTPVRG